MTLRPWREVAVPHEDVLKGTFQQAEFAADLSRVHEGTATAEYQDPVLFFQRTFITEGMRLLLDSVVKRLSGRGGDPVIQLQTAFGGGKTHTMLAVYHLAKAEVPTSNLQGIPPILDAAGIIDLPKAKVAVLDGIKLSPNQPQNKGNVIVHTIWGELAWQLGGEEAYEKVKDADLSGTSPGKKVLAQLLNDYSPCVILIDELVAYIRQFEDGKSFTGGTYDSNLSFIQGLTEALKAAPKSILLASLPESDKEAGSQRGINALQSLEHYFARVHALWKPVATEEAFEIVRRRLFANINDSSAASAVCRSFAEFYISNGDEFPHETQEMRYYERLVNAYPIHPELFDRLYEDWSSLDNFQRTRGVLKLMAKVIHRLWKDGNNDLLIMPGNLPLYDSETRNEVIYYLPQGWDPVLERDIDGERSETVAIENLDTRFGSIHACRRVARTIFLGSAPETQKHMVRGVETEHIILGSVQPGQQPAVFKDALKRLTDRLHYLNKTNNRFWFDTRPNLRREMEERKRRFQDKEDVFPAIRDILDHNLGKGYFGGVHTFTPSGDVPDDYALRLVCLSPDCTFSRSDMSSAIWKATEILKNRGETPRQKQNRLLFLAADHDSLSLLKDQVRSMLAWESIVNDYKENRIVLDNLMAKNASESLENIRKTLKRTIRETYKWLLAPIQNFNPGVGISEIQWEHFQINPGSQSFMKEIESLLVNNELVIPEWAPIHLKNLLDKWFWKDELKVVKALDVWQKSCCYLYLPRLKDDSVFRNTLIAGVSSKDFFGTAYGKEETKYIGFNFGNNVTPILDDSLLLIDPREAAPYAEKTETIIIPSKNGLGSSQKEGTAALDGKDSYDPKPKVIEKIIFEQKKNRFYGSVSIDPLRAKLDFSQVVDEIIMQFTATQPDAEVKVIVEIQADSSKGFDENLQRTIKENSNVLKFKNVEFD